MRPQFVPQTYAFGDPANTGLEASNINWEEMPSELFANANLNFDPQAFFTDYLYNGKVHRHVIPPAAKLTVSRTNQFGWVQCWIHGSISAYNDAPWGVMNNNKV